MSTPITEVTTPDGGNCVIERHADGRPKKLIITDNAGTTETYEPTEDGLKITVESDGASATATIKTREAAGHRPSTETGRRAAAAIEAARSARRRQELRTVAETLIDRVEAAETKAERDDASAPAYEALLAGGAAAWWNQRLGSEAA